MSFWDMFTSKNTTNSSSSNTKNIGQLEKKIRSTFNNLEDSELVKMTCLSGLMARVAYVDLNIDNDEKESIKNALIKWLDLDLLLAEKVTDLTIQETQELAGTENHRYTRPLKECLTTDDRYKVLELLFNVAASDGNADNLESEEIRIISKGLGLEHQHFISARATVKDFLGSLK